MTDDRETQQGTGSRVLGYALLLGLFALGVLRHKREHRQLATAQAAPSAVSSEDLLRPPTPERPVWFTLLGAPIAWLVHFLAIWGISEAPCPTGLAGNAVLGLNTAAALTLVASLIALIAMAVAGAVGYRLWRAGRAAQVRSHDADSRAHAGLIGMLLSGLLALTVILETAPFLLFAPCL